MRLYVGGSGMNQKWGLRAAGYAALCCLLSGLLALRSASASEGAQLEGTWKIGAPQSSFKPVGGTLPFTVEGRRRYEQNKRLQAARNYDEYDYTMSRCASPGVPRIMLTPDRFRIYQRPDYIQLTFEWNRLIRQIALPGITPQEEAPISKRDSPSEFGTLRGQSVGRWEGNTLVVVTDQFTEALIDDLIPHGYSLKVIERFRLTDTDTLEDRITIEDADYFTQPWETVVTYKRQPDMPFKEDICLDRLGAGESPLPR